MFISKISDISKMWGIDRFLKCKTSCPAFSITFAGTTLIFSQFDYSKVFLKMLVMTFNNISAGGVIF